MNDLYRDLVKVNENMYNLYTQYINHFQKLNQQWIESLWGPFLAKVQMKEKEEIKATTEEKKE
jgi:2-oxo-4-hydroxy-4-carboxy--5-ureidoimidazoline (OHCU) decarboxylase